MPRSRPRFRRARAALAATVTAAATVAVTPGAATAAVPFAAATPQGPLTSTACARVGTADTCELYAKPGTMTPAGAAPVNIWGLASTDTAAPSTPGPVLVVTVGDTVTINLHNGLADPLGLALPQVSGVAAPTPTAAGATGAITFTAARPGTYLYEAGHTALGARQTAMGIVGALVVRPAAAGQAYDTPASAFDDEAVLVLSEVDPAFNANPAGFDLRNFHPTYRLINGKSYPQTDPVATGPGRKVLLRYVNAGVTDHAMGVAGARQIPVGVDARPNPDAFPLFADTLAPGQTEDMVTVVPPDTDGTQFAVYETAGRLDNAGARAGATSTQIGFGGMLTFLQTGAVAPVGDTFGPVASAVAVTPGAVKATDTNVTVSATVSDAANGNSAVTAAEYVIDTPAAVTPGGGTPLTGTFGTPTVTGLSAAIPAATLQTLTQGAHTVYVRGRDAAGNWGPPASATFQLTTVGAATTGVSVTPNVTNGSVDVTVKATGDDSGLGGTVTAAEFFLSATGAGGTGTPMTLGSPNATLSTETGTLTAQAVQANPDGATSVFVHTKDSFGIWGPFTAVPLTITRALPTASGVTIDPNPTDGTKGSAVDATQIQVKGTFTVPGTPPLTTIAAAEGFLDPATANPANGTGFVFVANDGKFDAASEIAYGLIPLSQVSALADGAHTVYVHARDTAGNWGPLTAATLTVSRGVGVSAVSAVLTPAAPSVGAATTAVTLTATATLPPGTTAPPQAAEWFLGADPGAGNGRPMTISTVSASTFTLAGTVPPGLFTTPGPVTLSVRARGANGTWGTATPVTVTVAAQPVRIFADTFDTSTANWSSATGNPAVTGAQLAPTLGQFVTDTTPANQSPYTASFAFTPSTLATTAAGNATILRALTGANTEVYSVQYQRMAANTYRLRLVRGLAISNWVTVTGAGVANVQRTITVTFSTTATTSTTRLSVAGGAGITGSPVTLTGTGAAAAAQRVETVNLGLIAGTAGTTGGPRLDTFLSSRN
jgi:Multicopper oxidase